MADLPEVRGYEYTEWDCPNCDCVNREEGDVKGDTCWCDDCDTPVIVT